jgi:hypothetical protein
MPFRLLVYVLGALTCCATALANDVQFHICAAAQNLGQAYARTQYFNGELGPDQSADVAANLANAAAHIAAAESGVQQPFFSYPTRVQSIADLQAKLAAYARNAEGRSPSARMSMIQGFYTHYRFALSLSYASNRPDDFRWNPTCDSQMLDANWHLGLAATYAAVRFERGTIEETHARSAQGGANGSAFQAIRVGLRQALDGTGPTPLEWCFFNTEQAWSIVPMLPNDEPWETYVGLLPRVLEVCRSAGPHHGRGYDIIVPHVAGLLLADARRRMTEAGLTVQLGPGSPAPSAADTGRVEAQSIAAGTRVAAGTPVRLTVHSPYVPPRVAAPPPAVVTGEQPAVACPERLMRQVVPGAFNACPNMEWSLVPGSGRIGRNRLGSGFSCWYHVPNAQQSGGGRLCEQPDLYLNVRWIGVGATDFDPRVLADFCKPDLFVNGLAADNERMRRGEEPMMTPNHWKLYSRTHKVWVEFHTEAWDERYGLSVARQMIAQIEPYAQTCSGAPATGPTPAPVFQVPTPVPAPTQPPAPPTCPGPAVTVVYDLWNPPPYGGLGGIVCRDGAGGMWINIANNIYQVNSIRTGARDPSTGCFAATGVVTPVHTYEGTLCPK